MNNDSDALEILNKRWKNDPELMEMCKNEANRLELALKIKSSREKLGLTHDQIADALGISTADVLEIEDPDSEEKIDNLPLAALFSYFSTMQYLNSKPITLHSAPLKFRVASFMPTSKEQIIEIKNA